MLTVSQRDDDGEDDLDPTKMLLLEENGVNGGSSSPVRDGAPEHQLHQQHYIRSIESTVVIRQLPSQGLSFQLWPAATTLVTLLDNHRRDPSQSPLTETLKALSSNGAESSTLNILELGSGTGIVGIAAAATLSADVTMTDLPHVIERWVHVAPLRWGEAGDVELIGRRFDLILASDVVYHDHLYDPLLETLRLLLLGSEKRMLVMAHLRRWKKESVFFKKARKLFDVDVIHSDDPLEGSRIGVVVYRFARKRRKQNSGL
ncbi:PREDICTED: protein N-lysine methyltransferase METTL21A-like [Tarenaya hassleriana]|uniref:protein N-lysine methyltransferase METTL21A-like n=1 Tax=Tarenaya hassleriana TaxID=28532 RepID=UPI00053C52D4|nr:PREDICTED: protein N-lysine methyltransferase METTL21A-like [Tarenaya hassleriana]XP_010550415.1 PREDICTED: protein N-lysine methyltransferase METTL21A-like [Tarenaya hassleriana]XP_010550416.1 PREDICTED: protein N-lysine methyltransferase METTL21A-like [Tarenaya hassleriana]XP_010550417.1 PREDICTED: protein N-lysine methyltransferase METTL21A-like [Tarenaya hassleriana]XP_010550418.1 PREDICTED: protein N-lysine methyltransferase METTL21A-like [Tarenaya hassleriana]